MRWLLIMLEPGKRLGNTHRDLKNHIHTSLSTTGGNLLPLHLVFNHRETRWQIPFSVKALWTTTAIMVQVP